MFSDKATELESTSMKIIPNNLLFENQEMFSVLESGGKSNETHGRTNELDA